MCGIPASCLELFIDRQFDSTLCAACFTQDKLSLLQMLEKENETTVNVIKYKVATTSLLPDQHSWSQGWKPHNLVLSLGGCSWWQPWSFGSCLGCIGPLAVLSLRHMYKLGAVFSLLDNQSMFPVELGFLAIPGCELMNKRKCFINLVLNWSTFAADVNLLTQFPFWESILYT